MVSLLAVVFMIWEQALLNQSIINAKRHANKEYDRYHDIIYLFLSVNYPQLSLKVHFDKKIKVLISFICHIIEAYVQPRIFSSGKALLQGDCFGRVI